MKTLKKTQADKTKKVKLHKYLCKSVAVDDKFYYTDNDSDVDDRGVFEISHSRTVMNVDLSKYKFMYQGFMQYYELKTIRNKKITSEAR